MMGAGKEHQIAEHMLHLELELLTYHKTKRSIRTILILRNTQGYLHVIRQATIIEC